jgi:hypothetical protein
MAGPWLIAACPSWPGWLLQLAWVKRPCQRSQRDSCSMCPPSAALAGPCPPLGPPIRVPHKGLATFSPCKDKSVNRAWGWGLVGH